MKNENHKKQIKLDPIYPGKHIVTNNKTRTVQPESSKFASLLFDLGFKIVITPRIVANVHCKCLQTDDRQTNF